MNCLVSSTLVLASVFFAAEAVSVSAANAVVWTLNGVTFDDGGTASGTFTIDQYGYFLNGSATVTTTAGSTANGHGGPLPGDTYDDTLVAPSINNPADTLTTFFSSTNGYQGTLVLEFQHSLWTWRGVNLIIGGYECGVGFGCPNPSGGSTDTRYVTGGYAYGAPEASTWVMMILGAGLLGFASSRRPRALQRVGA